MFARISLLSLLVLASGLTVHQDPYEAMSKIKIPLKPILIPCYLQDILIVSAPVVKSAQYFLSRPNGDTTRLNITRPTYHHNDIINDEYDNIIIKHEKHFQGIIPVSNYKVFDLLFENFSNVQTYEEKIEGLNANDFVIGPLLQEDHGNWMLSAYYVDADGEWVEMYQVISIEITDYVPPSPRIADLKPGETFSFSFAYPIQGLQSCELMAPKSTFDRFFERDDKIDLHRCGYVIRNVTRKDRGLWRITAVGRIVYLTQLTLEVLET